MNKYGRQDQINFHELLTYLGSKAKATAPAKNTITVAKIPPTKTTRTRVVLGGRDISWLLHISFWEVISERTQYFCRGN